MNNGPYITRPLCSINKTVRAIRARRRSPAAAALFNTSLPFKPMTIRNVKVYTRKVKHKEPLLD